jgi:membrane protein DedA with SNARE-associated domain
MPLGRFMAWDVPAAVIWSAVVMSLGYVIGRPAAEWLDRGGWIVSLVVLALLGGWWLARRWRRRRAAPVSP